MGFHVGKFAKVGCVGFALGGFGLALEAAEPRTPTVSESAGEVVPVAGTYSSFIESLIEDARQDGSVSMEERKLIISQAQRRLGAVEVAEIEARLASMATTTKGDDQAASADNAAANGADCGRCCDEPGCGGLLENIYLFAAADAWKSIVDDNDGNNFGARIGFNSGMPLIESLGIGAQFGMSYGAYDLHGRQEGAEDSAIEEQLFLTAGIFKRSNLCCECPDRISWGIVYDHMITDNLGEQGWEIGLGQLRAQVGYAINPTVEVGLMGAVRVDEDELGGSSNDAFNVWALDYVSLFCHKKWQWGADTWAYIGLPEDPGELLFGARAEVPISCCVSLFGAAQYVLPSTRGGDSGTTSSSFAQEYWNVTFGIAYYPHVPALTKCVSGRRWMPLLPVADNGSFMLEVHPKAL
jgi:hypothetical protein